MIKSIRNIFRHHPGALCLAIILSSCLQACFQASPGGENARLSIPGIAGAWWEIAGNPDLGAYTSDKQQPVDFAIWQAADGTWQLVSCIRGTKCGGHTRLFYRWEGKALTLSHWQAKGIAMEADTSLGEAWGGLQAPYVFKRGDRYYMIYGDWNRICLATSKDGKNFTRVLNDKGEPDLFTGPFNNTRDPMILQDNGLYYCYYTGHTNEDGLMGDSGQLMPAPFKCAVFCRSSADLKHWSKPVMVAAGGTADKRSSWFGGGAECPFVVKKDGYFYLFRNQVYGKENLNTEYASRDPFNFGVGQDDFMIATLPVAAPEIIHFKNRYYIAALNPGLDGIRLAPLRWKPVHHSKDLR